MAWSAQIVSVLDEPVPSGVKAVSVMFTADNGRTIRRGYSLSADLVSNAQDALAFIQAECAKLDAADQMADDLARVLGSTITAVSAPQV